MVNNLLRLSLTISLEGEDDEDELESEEREANSIISCIDLVPPSLLKLNLNLAFCAFHNSDVLEKRRIYTARILSRCQSLTWLHLHRETWGSSFYSEDVTLDIPRSLQTLFITYDVLGNISDDLLSHSLAGRGQSN